MKFKFYVIIAVLTFYLNSAAQPTPHYTKPTKGRVKDDIISNVCKLEFPFNSLGKEGCITMAGFKIKNDTNEPLIMTCLHGLILYNNNVYNEDWEKIPLYFSFDEEIPVRDTAEIVSINLTKDLVILKLNSNNDAQKKGRLERVNGLTINSQPISIRKHRDLNLFIPYFNVKRRFSKVEKTRFDDTEYHGDKNSLFVYPISEEINNHMSDNNSKDSAVYDLNINLIADTTNIIIANEKPRTGNSGMPWIKYNYERRWCEEVVGIYFYGFSEKGENTYSKQWAILFDDSLKGFQTYSEVKNQLSEITNKFIKTSERFKSNFTVNNFLNISGLSEDFFYMNKKIPLFPPEPEKPIFSDDYVLSVIEAYQYLDDSCLYPLIKENYSYYDNNRFKPLWFFTHISNTYSSKDSLHIPFDNKGFIGTRSVEGYKEKKIESKDSPLLKSEFFKKYPNESDSKDTKEPLSVINYKEKIYPSISKYKLTRTLMVALDYYFASQKSNSKVSDKIGLKNSKFLLIAQDTLFALNNMLNNIDPSDNYIKEELSKWKKSGYDFDGVVEYVKTVVYNKITLDSLIKRAVESESQGNYLQAKVTYLQADSIQPKCSNINININHKISELNSKIETICNENLIKAKRLFKNDSCLNQAYSSCLIAQNHCKADREIIYLCDSIHDRIESLNKRKNKDDLKKEINDFFNNYVSNKHIEGISNNYGSAKLSVEIRELPNEPNMWNFKIVIGGDNNNEKTNYFLSSVFDNFPVGRSELTSPIRYSISTVEDILYQFRNNFMNYFIKDSSVSTFIGVADGIPYKGKFINQNNISPGSQVIDFTNFDKKTIQQIINIPAGSNEKDRWNNLALGYSRAYNVGLSLKNVTNSITNSNRIFAFHDKKIGNSIRRVEYEVKLKLDVTKITESENHSSIEVYCE